MDPESVGPLAALGGSGGAVVGQCSAGLEEDRVEEVLQRAGHVAEVRGRAEEVAVRAEHVVSSRGQRLTDHQLDTLDGVVARARDDGVGELANREGGGVVDHEQSGHGESLRGRVASRGVSFDVDGEAYDRFMGRYSRPLAARFADWLGPRPGQRVLDVGCGPGALTEHLVALVGAAQVAAIDPSEPFVVACRSRHPGVDVRLGAAETCPFDDDTFDVTAACLVVHFMSDPVAGLAEMKRVTRTGGWVGGDRVGPGRLACADVAAVGGR